MHRGDLDHDVSAIAIPLDHLLQSSDLALDSAQPLQIRRLDARFDGDSLALHRVRLATAIQRLLADTDLLTVDPDPAEVAGFDAFMQRYIAALPVERAAIEHTQANS